MKDLSRIVVSALIFALVAGPSRYIAADFILNGSFENNTGAGQIDNNSTVANWTTTRGGTGVVA